MTLICWSLLFPAHWVFMGFQTNQYITIRPCDPSFGRVSESVASWMSIQLIRKASTGVKATALASYLAPLFGTRTPCGTFRPNAWAVLRPRVRRDHVPKGTGDSGTGCPVELTVGRRKQNGRISNSQNSHKLP